MVEAPGSWEDILCYDKDRIICIAVKGFSRLTFSALVTEGNETTFLR